jgi:hypothetical protein
MEKKGMKQALPVSLGHWVTDAFLLIAFWRLGISMTSFCMVMGSQANTLKSGFMCESGHDFYRLVNLALK